MGATGMQKQKDFEFRVQWGATERKFGREHPNLDRSFNSKAVVENATAHLRDEMPGILIQVSHPEFVEGVSGTVRVDSGLARAKELAEFVSKRKGKTIEEVAAEVRASGLFS